MIEVWFRAQDSNLRSWVQSPVSCLLDDPGSVGGSGGIRTLAVSGKSRVRFQLRYGPARGTRGTRTLIPRVKSPVPFR